MLGAIGLFTRTAMIVAFVLGTYLLGLPHNFGQTQHFDSLAVFVLGALALSRAADTWSIDALLAAIKRGSAERPADAAEYAWPIRFVWVAMALIFWAAGLSKLRHAGLAWIFSRQPRDAAAPAAVSHLRWRTDHLVGPHRCPAARAVTNAGWRLGCRGIVLSARALQPHRTDTSGAVRALAFLIGIRLLMGPTFEQFMICFVFWVPWHHVSAGVRARVARRRPARLVVYDGGCRVCLQSVAALARLDLLGRVQFENVATESDRLSARGSELDRTRRTTLHVITPEGELRHPFYAYRSLARVLPLGWVMLPILYVPGLPALVRWVGALPHRTPPFPVTGTRTAATSRLRK